MKLDMRWSGRVDRLQASLRAYAFGPDLDREAAALLAVLAPLRRRRAETGDRLTLKALALAAEYLDAHGRAAEADALLSRTVSALLEGEMGREGDMKLHRQQVWCCLAHALSLLRASRNSEAGSVLEQTSDFVRAHLITTDFPCHGTVALLHYYRGLWRRNTGSLDVATREFDQSLDQTRQRHEEKRARYETQDPTRFQRERIYHRVLMARVLGFGHGGVSLARGRYAEARGWITAASLVLSGLGQDTWRRSLEVYERSSAVLLESMEAEAADRFRQHAARLRELEAWFERVNRRNGFVAGAYAVVAEMRARQLEAGPDAVVSLSGLKGRIDRLLSPEAADAGPLSASATLALAESLLRGGEHEHCERVLRRFSRQHARDEEIESERLLLEAELWLATGRETDALRSLRDLVQSRLPNRARRTRVHALLAAAQWRAGEEAAARQSWLAAQESAEMAQDGYSRWMVESLQGKLHSQSLPAPMPYQREDDPQWCDMDHNLEQARLNVVAALAARQPELSIEALAAAAGRGSSWLYALLSRHRQEPWVARLLKRAG